jgi:hypothetical protein
MSFNLDKKFNEEYEQTPQSSKENLFQSKSKSKKTICCSPHTKSQISSETLAIIPR